MWYGIADCIADDVEVNLVFDVCGSICDSHCPNVISLSCLTIKEVKIKFDESKTSCKFSEQSFLSFTSIAMWLDSQLFRHIANLMEIMGPSMATPYSDDILKYAGIPRTCGDCTKNPFVDDVEQEIAILA